MKRKYLIVWVSFLLALFILCGCSKKMEKKKDNSTKLPTLTVGCDTYPPFSYLDTDGQLTGIDVKLGKEAFQRMGYSPKFIVINWEQKKKLLEKGDIDCIWSSFTIDGREKEYRWAGPYMRSQHVIAVRKESNIQNLQDLKDKVVAVQSTTKPEDIIRSHDGTLPKLKKVISVQKRDLIFILLSKGYVDALAAHITSVNQFMEETGIQFRVLKQSMQNVGLGVAFAKSDRRGIDKELSKTLEEMKKDGTTKRIISEYLSNADQYLEGDHAQN